MDIMKAIRFLIRHFKSGWSKHIIGAQKELFRDYTKVFLIQCYEHELRADNEWYKFSIDKEILEIINRSIIDYVIFDNGEYVEVIERAYIPNIIDNLNSKEFYIKAHVKLQFSSVVEGET